VEIEDLLRRASAAPLGPIAFTLRSASPDAWIISVTLGDRTREVRAERHAATNGLVLACKIDKNASNPTAETWITQTTYKADGDYWERRLWLHGDGLSPALLLNALGALVAVASPVDAQESAQVEAEPIIIPSPPPGPNPVPVERARLVGWNSFGFGHREAPAPEEPASSPPVPSPPSPEPVVDVPTAAAEERTEMAVEHAPEAVDEAQSEVEDKAMVVEVAVQSEPEPLATSAGPDSKPGPAAVSETVEGAGKAGYCRECGSPYLPDHAFCTNCGARLN
jgi:hypothetical protein